MLTKRKLAGGKVRVVFAMPALEGVTQMHLVGDFNDWSETATPLTRARDGSWSVAVTLEGGRTYQYRYLANGEKWHNDWQADGYAPNDFGSENSVVDLAPAKNGAPRRKAPARKRITKV
jgi:1,4-alpha-glucan branching enzyme